MYGDLVEKCLKCNFGVATTLDKAELRSAVLVHMVNQLDICLEKYIEFQGLVPPRNEGRISTSKIWSVSSACEKPMKTQVIWHVLGQKSLSVAGLTEEFDRMQTTAYSFCSAVPS